MESRGQKARLEPEAKVRGRIRAGGSRTNSRTGDRCMKQRMPNRLPRIALVCGGLCCVWLGSSSGAEGGGETHDDTTNETFVAGNLLGRKFYYQHDRVALDTIGWSGASRRLFGNRLSADAGKAPSGLAKEIAEKRGKSVVEIKKPTALSLAILKDLGYPVFALTQWTGFVHIPRGYDTQSSLEDENIISHFLYEVVDSAEVERPGGTVPHYGVRLFFFFFGCCDFKGNEVLTLSRSQILCTAGFEMKEKYRDLDKYKDFVFEGNPFRIIVRLFMIAAPEKEPAEIVDEIEEVMDELRLDLSYGIPELVTVD